MQSIFRISALSMGLTLAACGGGGGDTSTPTPSPTPAPTPAPTGSIDIDVTGLPNGANASIAVTGPDNFSTSVSGGTSLDDLTLGSYNLTIEAVPTIQGTFDSLPAQITIEVDGDETVSVLYQTPIISEGPIEGFGSLVVNGTRFDSNAATISGDDDENDETSLDLGMVVQVVGRTTADGSVTTAQHVNYYAAAEGPISSISFSQNQFTVLGQTFNVDNETRFLDRQFVDLRLGDIVEVSAIGTAEQLTATRVEYYVQMEDDFDVSGKVANLDNAAMTFTIGALTVDFSGANIDGTLANDALVSVESNQAPVNDVFIADEVDVRGADGNNPNPNPGKLVREGLITQVTETQVQVDNRELFTLTDATQYVNGTRNELAVDLRVMVRGVEVNDDLIAEQIVFIPANTVNVSGTVTELDTNEIRVYGTEFDVNSATQIVDMRATPPQTITLSDISLGDQVTIQGFYAYDNDLTARRIELTSGNGAGGGAGGGNAGELEIEGSLQSFTAPTAELAGSFVIDGLTIDTSASTLFYLLERYVTANEFFANIVVGDRIEVDASLLDGRILAYEVEKDRRSNGGNNRTFEIEGTISSSLANGAFELAGLTILIDTDTRYDDGNESGLVEGAMVEVRAREDEEGNIIAIYIDFESRDDGDDDDDDNRGEIEIEGRISNLDTGAMTFNINNQLVQYSSNTTVENGSLADLVNNLWVEAEGYLDAAGTLITDYIYIEEDREDDLEGTISSVIDNNHFVVNGVTVEITSQTEFENGNRSNIQVGVYVEVEGVFQGNDRMRAWEIYFED